MLYSASLACADYLNMERDIRSLSEGGIHMAHLDVMDGHYVPNLSLNLDLISRIRETFPDMQLDVHLMVTDPMAYIKPLALVKADYVSFHFSATSFPIRTARAIREAGMRAGIVVNPGEPLSLIDEIIDNTDMVLLMSIEPGFSGQQFIPSTYKKIHDLARIRREKKLNFIINVDGGINLANGRECISTGADCLVLGLFAIFNQPEGIVKASRSFIETIQNEGK